jgi:hypothetical protein
VTKSSALTRLYAKSTEMGMPPEELKIKYQPETTEGFLLSLTVLIAV